MVTFKFKRVCVDYCEIEAENIDQAWEIIYSGDSDWLDCDTIDISEIETGD